MFIPTKLCTYTDVTNNATVVLMRPCNNLEVVHDCSNHATTKKLLYGMLKHNIISLSGPQPTLPSLAKEDKCSYTHCYNNTVPAVIVGSLWLFGGFIIHRHSMIFDWLPG